MYRECNVREREWLEKLLAAPFRGKEILQKQLANAAVSVQQGCAFLSLKLLVKNETGKYPYPVRVPVEMRAYQEKTAPVVFLLHVLDGMADELEIVTADLSQIDPEYIRLDNVEYAVDKTVAVMDRAR